MEKMKENDTFSVTPVKKYTSPKYPTYDDARDNSTLLKKLPSRWKKNAKVLACLGLIGTFALVSNAEPLTGGTEANGYGESNAYYLKPADDFFDVTVRLHGGGSGVSPFYVVYLTEQEALNIIRAEAEAAGLRLNSVPPDYTVDIGPIGLRTAVVPPGYTVDTVDIGPLLDQLWERRVINIGLDLFDEENDIAIAFVHEVSGLQRGWNITELFASHNNDITVGLFFDRGVPFASFDGAPYFREGTPISGGEMTHEERRNLLRENLASQVREFIESLRTRGILQ